MGLATFGATAYCSATASIPGLHSMTDMTVVVRLKVDELRSLSGYFASALGQQDDGSAPNTSYVWRLQAEDNNGPKRIRLVIFNIGGADTGWIPLASWPANGQFIVACLWHTQSNFQAGFSIYDGTGTGTLVDGQPPATSIFHGTKALNGVIPHTAGDGILRIGYAGTGVNNSNVIDGWAMYSGLRDSDAEPKNTDPGYICSYKFADGTGTITTFAEAYGGTSLTTTAGTITEAAGGAWPPQSSTPTTVIATPSALQVNLPPGATATASLATDDQNGAAMTSRSWTISTPPNAAVATASITGSTLTVTSVATGQTSLVVSDSASGGGSASPATVNVTVGTQYDWAYPGIATGATGAATEQVAEASAGSGTLTITRHGTSASCSVSLVFTSGGGGNEPSGMTVGVNTGDLTIAPPTAAQVAAGTTTWNIGSALTTQVQMFSPGGAEPAAGYQAGWAGNLTLCPDGPGYRQRYSTLMAAGYSPVRWGFPLAQPASPTGYQYGSALYRMGGDTAVWSSVGQTGQAIAGTKFFFIRTKQTTENHAIVTTADNTRLGGSTYDNYFGVFLQGPNGQSFAWPNIYFSAWSSSKLYGTGSTVKAPNGLTYVCILDNTNQQPPNATYWTAVSPGFSFNSLVPNARIPVDGAYHKIEWLAQPESPAGAGNGTFDGWVGGVHIFQRYDLVNWLATGEPQGWPYIMFDGTYGGAPSAADSPPQVQNIDMNQFYVSTK